MKREVSAVERPEVRGAVVGRWFLPEWWVGAMTQGSSSDKSVLRLAQLAAAVAAVAIVVVVVAGSGGR